MISLPFVHPICPADLAGFSMHRPFWKYPTGPSRQNLSPVMKPDKQIKPTFVTSCTESSGGEDRVYGVVQERTDDDQIAF